ncbi:MAG TPA: hypothetical protein VE821_01115 [Pyrinomonadaceae bacterium]|nr:hypothetical protein [Pyrinomonadaceae bacterium]
MPSLRFILIPSCRTPANDSAETDGASEIPFAGSSLLASESPQRGFMQIDAPSAENVSLAPLNLAVCFYPENTGLVDFVAKDFSLSDQRQQTCDERPKSASSFISQQ